MSPATRNDSHRAEPATAPASPRSAKIPAPTIAPIPRNTAPRRLMVGTRDAGAPRSFSAIGWMFTTSTGVGIARIG